jgi:hypothetical protein
VSKEHDDRPSAVELVASLKQEVGAGTWHRPEENYKYFVFSNLSFLVLLSFVFYIAAFAFTFCT